MFTEIGFLQTLAMQWPDDEAAEKEKKKKKKKANQEDWIVDDDDDVKPGKKRGRNTRE